MMDNIFNEKIFLVTGASSGIGRATAIELSSLGASVAILGRREKALEDTAKMLDPERTLIIPCDLTDFTSLQDTVDRVVDWKKRLDGLAYCAGVGGRSRLRDTSPEVISNLLTINCLAFVELMRKIAKKKLTSLQTVVLSSLASMGHDKYFTAYAASKAALETAAKTLATELLSKKIMINILRCAFVATPMVLGDADPLGDFEERLRESGYQPLGLIPPEIVAKTVAFLLGPSASFCSGTIFTINAGAPC